MKYKAKYHDHKYIYTLPAGVAVVAVRQVLDQ